MGGSTRILAFFSAPPPPLFARVNRTCLTRLYCRRSSPSSSRSSVGLNHRICHVSASYSPPPITTPSIRRLHASACKCSAAGFVLHREDGSWPEWSALVDSLSSAGYFLDHPPAKDTEAEHGLVSDFPAELLRPAQACLNFACDRPNLFVMLSMKDIETVVENGFPFLFKNGEASVKRLKLYLSSRHGVSNVVDMDKPSTVDLMRFLLSYVGRFASLESSNHDNGELVESAVRNLLAELAKLSSAIPEPNLYESVQNQASDKYGQTTPSPVGVKMEMKRGDWICPRCNFMNFSKNVKCLECKEERPRRQLTGGEWECPQCDFFNYGRNTVCLRCDCKCPGDVSVNFVMSGNSNNADLQRRLAENEEKAQRWFSKVSQLDSASEMSSTIKDEDFPEIMPLRKGVNRFVVSTRKTPLERRLADAQSRRSTGRGNENKRSETDISNNLDEIFGRSSMVSGSDDEFVSSGQNDGADSSPPSSNMFAKGPEDPNAERRELGISNAFEETRGVSVNSDKLMNQNEMAGREREQAEKSERWFNRVAELHNVSDIASAISDDDFPEIMPMRKGENRFVVSRKKDRSLTSPAYKRRMAMKQSQSSDFVPFVPFPPDYFAKKNHKQQPEAADSASKAPDGTSPSVVQEKSDDSASSSQDSSTFSASNINNSSNGLPEKENMRVTTGFPHRTDDSFEESETMGIRNNSWSGKSLEGSAVKEPDPLDMSEEAKAERWFKRVAHIKDISELRQIPDEDFPSIMPMRKGVNRFVISKRKTPLERRLTSRQYRGNLPNANSDPSEEGK